MRQEKLKEGYHIFTAIETSTLGFEKCAADLQAQVNAAEKDFDLTFISNASFKDDGSSSRNVYFGSQTAVLTRKKK